MGNWHQSLVVKRVSDEELEKVADVAINYLIERKIIHAKQGDNVLRGDIGYGPGQNWAFVVEYPEENHFLRSLTNGMEICKGRTVFYADGREFESISCPSCNANNLECDWGELFSQWLSDPNSANLKCKKCGISNSISDYKFEPKWALSNLGFVFWNWPMFKKSFIDELEKVIGKTIILVEGKL
jgi:hypothetical protein